MLPRTTPLPRAAAGATRQHAALPRAHRRSHTCWQARAAAQQQPGRGSGAREPVLPQDVDLNDPELKEQIDALLRELDPELLDPDTQTLLDAKPVADTPKQQRGPEQRAQRAFGPEPPAPSPTAPTAAAPTDADDAADDEESEGGLPDGLVVSRAEYGRKAAVLVELMSALQAVDEEVLQQKLAAFRVEVDEVLLHMLGRRIEVAQAAGQEPEALAGLRGLLDLLQLKFARGQASPAMRLLDEVLDLLGEDPLLPGGRQRAEAVLARLRSAFTGGASDGLDIFAAAEALAADKAIAAEVLAVEFVAQPLFMAEASELLASAQREMQALAAAVGEAQAELQAVRNAQPALLQSPQAQAHMQQVAHADEVLQQRRLAVGQLSYVLTLAQDLDAAEQALQAGALPPVPTAAAAAGEDGGGGEGDVAADAERLAALLGLTEGGSRSGPLR